MKYDKAIANYQKVVARLDEEIQKRESKIEELKSSIKDIRENRKSEIKKGIFSGEVKLFSKTEDIQKLATQVEVMLTEIEGLKELKAGDSEDLRKAALEVTLAAVEEQERIVKHRAELDLEIERLEQRRLEVIKELQETHWAGIGFSNNACAEFRELLVNLSSEEKVQRYASNYNLAILAKELLSK